MESIKLIAHRGNINGSLPERNTFSLYEAIEKGFDVEIDIRAVEHKGRKTGVYIAI